MMFPKLFYFKQMVNVVPKKNSKCGFPCNVDIKFYKKKFLIFFRNKILNWKEIVLELEKLKNSL